MEIIKNAIQIKPGILYYFYGVIKTSLRSLKSYSHNDGNNNSQKQFMNAIKQVYASI